MNETFDPVFFTFFMPSVMTSRCQAGWHQPQNKHTKNKKNKNSEAAMSKLQDTFTFSIGMCDAFKTWLMSFRKPL